jgi:erythromycin esterase-like protein
VFSLLPSVAQAQAPAKSAQALAAPDVKAFDKQLAEAQAQMKKMQEQMDRIRQTQDPQERQRLMQEHWTTMQSAMATMRGMWGPGMMGGAGRMRGPGMRQGMMGWGKVVRTLGIFAPEPSTASQEG